MTGRMPFLPVERGGIFVCLGSRSQPDIGKEAYDMQKKSIYTLTTLAMMAALSVILVFFIHFPIFPAVGFLEYDPADILVFISAMLFGPWYGLLLTAVVCIIQGLTVSASSQLYGILMHLIATGTHVLVCGLLYRHIEAKWGLPVSLLAGTAAWTLIMIPANLIITPWFMGVPQSAVAALLPFILAFNLIKAGVNSILAGGLFFPVQRLYRNVAYRN